MKYRRVKVLAPPNEQGAQPAVMVGENGMTLAEITRVGEGHPVAPGQSLVSLRSEGDGEFAVIDQFDHPQAAPQAAEHAGPARASTPAYREGWDAVFGRRGARELN